MKRGFDLAIVLFFVGGIPFALTGQNYEVPSQIRRQTLDPRSLSDQVKVEAIVQETAGGSATAERDPAKKDSYFFEIQTGLALPKPVEKWNELLQIYPELRDTMMAWPEEGVSGTRVSPFFWGIQQKQLREIARCLMLCLPLPPRTHFYDVDTILEVPANGEVPALVVIAGKFFARSPTTGFDPASMNGDGVAAIYEPLTAYRWKEPAQDSLNADRIRATREILQLLEKEYAIVGLPRARNRELEEGIAQRKAELAELPEWNYLNGEEFPFISLPVIYRQYRDDALAPKMGDIVFVIGKEKIYPCLYADDAREALAGELSAFLIKAMTSGENGRDTWPRALSIVAVPDSGNPVPNPDLDTLNERAREIISQLSPEAVNALHIWTVPAQETSPEAETSDNLPAALAPATDGN